MKVLQIKNKFIFLSSVINMNFNKEEKKITLILNKLTHTTLPIIINELQKIDYKDPKKFKIDSVLFSYDYETIDLNEKYDTITEEIKKFLVSNDNLFSFDKFI